MSPLQKVLIIDDVHELLIQGLKELGFEVDYRPQWSRNELLTHIGGYEGLVVRTKTNIDKEVLSHADKLKFVARAGAGMDNVDTTYCDNHGIKYMNAGEANADAVGEQTLAMLLSMMARVVKADKEVRKGIWDREGNRGEELKGKTVGIIGYGNTGKAVAAKLSGFGVKVLAYDKYLSHYSDAFARESTMENLFQESDVLSLHIPLTHETKGLVDVAFLSKFTKPIYFLNLSRGGVVKLEALCQFLETGQIKMAALDVLENEQLGKLTADQQKWFDYLRSAPNVILTPHIGGWTKESYLKISEVLLQKIKELTT